MLCAVRSFSIDAKYMPPIIPNTIQNVICVAQNGRVVHIHVPMLLLLENVNIIIMIKLLNFFNMIF